MHGRGWYARCLIMMCSNLGFQEPSTNATRQRDGWAVRSNVHVASLLECGNGYATIILHFLTTRTTVTGIAVRMVGPKQRYLAGLTEFVGIFGHPAGHHPWSWGCGALKTPRSVGTRILD